MTRADPPRRYAKHASDPHGTDAAPTEDLPGVIALQQTSGNQAVVRMLASARGSLITTGALASHWQRARAARPHHPRRADVRFRVPNAGAIKAMLAGGEIPEKDVKASIERALERMARENNLKSKDPVSEIMPRLFPSLNEFDEEEFARVVDTTDRSRVYERAADAQARLTPEAKVRVIAAMDAAGTLLDTAAADDAQLSSVFGGEAATAKANYVKAKAALLALKAGIDTKVHTDYNLDDAQLGLGGSATFAEQTVHLTPEVAAGEDPDEAAITIVHECCHLADAKVEDHGYYPPHAASSNGWEAMDEKTKVTNAAHYEEIPRRLLGKSVYRSDEVFTPGIAAATGGSLPFEDDVRRRVDDVLRTAWDTALQVHLKLRRIHLELEKGNTIVFTSRVARLVEISELEHLTIHNQTPHPHTITTLDLTLSEGLVRSLARVMRFAKERPLPPEPDTGKDADAHGLELAYGAITQQGGLVGDLNEDWRLIEWLNDNNGKDGL